MIHEEEEEDRRGTGEHNTRTTDGKRTGKRKSEVKKRKKARNRRRKEESCGDEDTRRKRGKKKVVRDDSRRSGRKESTTEMETRSGRTSMRSIAINKMRTFHSDVAADSRTWKQKKFQCLLRVPAPSSDRNKNPPVDCFPSTDFILWKFKSPGSLAHLSASVSFRHFYYFFSPFSSIVCVPFGRKLIRLLTFLPAVSQSFPASF